MEIYNRIPYSEETVRTFQEKELQKTSQTESKIEKEIKEKMMNYM